MAVTGASHINQGDNGSHSASENLEISLVTAARVNVAEAKQQGTFVTQYLGYSAERQQQ